jgi:hypothetical protein
MGKLVPVQLDLGRPETITAARGRTMYRWWCNAAIFIAATPLMAMRWPRWAWDEHQCVRSCQMAQALPLF